jgi:hypothetical protein
MDTCVVRSYLMALELNFSRVGGRRKVCFYVYVIFYIKRYYFIQVIICISCHQQWDGLKSRIPYKMQWEFSVSSVIVLSRICNLNLFMRKYQKNIFKITD